MRGDGTNAAQNSKEFVTITLLARGDDTPLVRSVELLSTTSRARFSFTARSDLNKIFQRPVAETLKELTERIARQRGLLALPDLCLSARGVTLEDCALICTDSPSGGLQVLARFNKFRGDLFALFSDTCEVRQRLSDGTTDDYAKLLKTAYLPLSDLAEHICATERQVENFSDDRVGAALLDIAYRIKKTNMIGSSGASSGEASPLEQDVGALQLSS